MSEEGGRSRTATWRTASCTAHDMPQGEIASFLSSNPSLESSGVAAVPLAPMDEASMTASGNNRSNPREVGSEEMPMPVRLRDRVEATGVFRLQALRANPKITNVKSVHKTYAFIFGR